MKFRTAACLLLAALPATAALAGGAMQPEAIIATSCAPWDGAAIDITIEFPNNTQYHANVWGKGLALLRDGKKVELDGNGNSEGTGQARLCDPIGKCNQVQSSIKIPASALSSDDPVNGSVLIEDTWLHVTARRMKNQKPQICG